MGEPTPAAPPMVAALPQIFFLWAPINFDDVALHYMVFEDPKGAAWSKTAAILPVIGPDGPVVGPDAPIEHLSAADHHIHFAKGLRRSEAATLEITRADGETERVELEPLFTFRMRGAGYLHPTWSHGRWHGGTEVGGEVFAVDDLDTVDFHNLHVQQVVRATWGDRVGLGVLEQLIIGPHGPSGFTDLNDGAS